MMLHYGLISREALAFNSRTPGYIHRWIYKTTNFYGSERPGLTGGRTMRIFNPKRYELRGWAPKAGWLAWRNYDFQLTTYAVLLTLFGLAMAYSNSVGSTHEAADSRSITFRSQHHVGRHRVVVLGLTTVFDYKWLRSFAWPLYLDQHRGLDPDPPHRYGNRRGRDRGPLGRRRRLSVPVQRTGQDHHGRRLCGVPGQPPTEDQVALDDHRGADDPGAAVGSRDAAAGPGHLPGAGRDRHRAAVHVRGEPVLAGHAGPGSGRGAIPFVWNNLRDYQQARLLTLLDPGADPNGAGYQLHPGPDGDQRGRGGRQGSDQRQRYRSRSPPRTSCGACWPRSSVSSVRMVVLLPVRPAHLAGARLRLAIATTRSRC